MTAKLQRLCLLWALALCTHAAWGQQQCEETPEGRVCRVQQPIVNGALVPANVQRDLGLVTVGGGCSGTLINRYWVLTADHCITTNGQVGGPSAALTNVRISAAWSPLVVTPSRMARDFFPAGRDVALLYLGERDFGAANVQLFFVDRVDETMTLTKYGRGIFAYASAGPPPTPAQQDGQYRSARFTPSNVNNTTYTLAVNAANQVANGGDSGGPDFATAPSGVALGITGVQSTCVSTGVVPGQIGGPWTWVTSISSCNSAAIEPIRERIIEIARERPSFSPSIAPIEYELAP